MICSKCGKTKIYLMPLAKHRDVIISTKLPTCTKTGKAVKHCTWCEREIPITVKKLGHAKKIKVKNGNKTSYVCSRCYKKY